MMKIIVLVLCLSFLLLAGCGQVQVRNKDDVVIFKANWLLYDWSLDKATYGKLMLERFDADAPDVKLTTPYGTLETED